jgi:putative phage-type endonuclease
MSLEIQQQINKELNNYSKEYSFEEFKKISKELHKKLKINNLENLDIDIFRNMMCNNITLNKTNNIIFFTDTTDIKNINKTYSYSDLKKFLKKQDLLLETKSKSIETKPTELKPIELKPTKKLGFMTKFKNTNSDEEKITVVNDNQNESNLYAYPKEKEYIKIQHNDYRSEPRGSQWLHDPKGQNDDLITEQVKQSTKTFNELASIKYAKQKSKEWFAQRDGAITASDGGCVIGQNHNEAPYKFILKKLGKIAFESNANCYNGTKYEDIAIMIYEYRKNVQVKEFGLVVHPKYSFLAASPDGIVTKYKLDGIHLTENVGRMLEIKCPTSRKIKPTSSALVEVPYYWVQMQLQLECCNLEICDFWQCIIKEYDSREDFNNDTNTQIPWTSRTTSFEKGCVIQFLPQIKFSTFVTEIIDDGEIKYQINEEKYLDALYSSAKHIYPPRIEMTPFEIDLWIAKELSNINNNENFIGYSLNKIIYWKLENSHCEVVNRDRKWFEENLPKYKEIWNHIINLRNEPLKCELFCNYANELKYEEINNLKNYIFKKNKNEDDVKNIVKILNIIIKSINDKKETGFIDDFIEKIKKYKGKYADFHLIEKIDEIYNKKLFNKIAEL